MPGESARDAARSDEDVELQLINTCLDLGMSRISAEEFAARALKHRRNAAEASRDGAAS